MLALKSILQSDFLQGLPATAVRTRSAVKANRGELSALLGLAVFGVVVRVALVPFAAFITSDGVYYATLAQNLRLGDLHGGLSTYWPPLYSLIIALFSSVLNDPVYAGRLVSAVAGGALVFPVYGLVRHWSRRRLTALLAAIFVIFEPRLIGYSLLVLTESLYMLVFVSAILVGWLALERGTGRHFFLCGLLFGLAYLIRPEALCYVPLVCLMVGVHSLARRVRWRGVISMAALVCVGALLASAPYLYYLRSETGRWTLSPKFGANLPGYGAMPRKLLPDGQLTLADIMWAGTKSEPALSSSENAVQPTTRTASELTTSISDKRTFLGSLKQHIKRTALGLYDEYRLIDQLFPPLMLILIGLGLFATAWTKDRLRLELYIWPFIFATLLGYGFTRHALRYLVPLIPLGLCWAAIGATRVASWLTLTWARAMQAKFPRVRVGERAALAGITLIVIVAASSNTISRVREDRWDPTPAANWIKSQGIESPLIMATGPWPAFYTGGRHLYIPSEDLPVILTYAKRKKIDFLVLEGRSLATTPSLAHLLEGKNTPSELTLVFEYKDSLGWVGVYRLS